MLLILGTLPGTHRRPVAPLGDEMSKARKFRRPSGHLPPPSNPLPPLNLCSFNGLFSDSKPTADTIFTTFLLPEPPELILPKPSKLSQPPEPPVPPDPPPNLPPNNLENLSHLHFSHYTPDLFNPRIKFYSQSLLLPYSSRSFMSAAPPSYSVHPPMRFGWSADPMNIIFDIAAPPFKCSSPSPLSCSTIGQALSQSYLEGRLMRSSGEDITPANPYIHASSAAGECFQWAWPNCSLSLSTYVILWAGQASSLSTVGTFLLLIAWSNSDFLDVIHSTSESQAHLHGTYSRSLFILEMANQVFSSSYEEGISSLSSSFEERSSSFSSSFEERSLSFSSCYKERTFSLSFPYGKSVLPCHLYMKGELLSVSIPSYLLNFFFDLLLSLMVSTNRVISKLSKEESWFLKSHVLVTMLTYLSFVSYFHVYCNQRGLSVLPPILYLDD